MTSPILPRSANECHVIVLFAIDSFCSGSMARFVRGTMLANAIKGSKGQGPQEMSLRHGEIWEMLIRQIETLTN